MRFREEKTAALGNQRMLIAVYDTVGVIIGALVILGLVISHFFRVVGVSGDSMQPTLYDSEYVLLAGTSDGYERGDIVVIDRYTEKPMIKRIIAVGGDTINIIYSADSSTVMVNGHIQYESYIQGNTILNDFSGERTIPEGYLFVMGDNRPVSKDSRKDEIGLISVKDVVGKAKYRVWPLSAIESLEN